MDNYYDLDRILAEHQKVPCEFKEEMRNIFQASSLNNEGPSEQDNLDEQSTQSDVIKAGTKVELPYWMAKNLAYKNLVEIGVPRCFGARARANLTADASVVNLNDLNPYFYLFATMILESSSDGEESRAVLVALSKVLNETFMTRLKMVLDLAQNSSYADFSEITKKMDATEKGLFKAAHDSTVSLQEWRDRKSGIIEMAESTSAGIGRKRKHP